MEHELIGVAASPRPRLSVLLLRVLTVAVASWACIASSGVSKAAQDTAAAAPEAELAARQLARAAMIDFRFVGSPQPDDYEFLALVLEEAYAINPQDEPLLRMLINAHSQAGNAERAADLTRALLKLAPEDTVAQLRLISRRISSLQDVDARLRAYRAFLGPRGESLDPSVRSRLALDAALLERERGDDTAFGDLLARSIDLDPSNKDAATLAVTVLAPQASDPLDALALQFGLLEADPFDGVTHLTIARQLAAAGAYQGASRFFRLARIIADRTRQPLSPSIIAEWQIIEWAAFGAEALVEQSKEELEAARQAARERLAQAAGAPLGVGGQASDPDQIRFSPEVMRIFVAAAHSIGDDDRVRWGLQEFARTIEESRVQLQDAAAQLPPNDRRLLVAQDAISRAVTELTWMRLWFGVELDFAGAALGRINEAEGLNPVAAERLNGWYAIQTGDIAAGVELLERWPDDQLCQLGLAVAAEKAGNAQEADRLLREHAERFAGTLTGVWAMSKVAGDDGVSAPVSALTPAFEEAAASVPIWIDRAIMEPRRFQDLGVEIEQRDVGPLGRIRLFVKIRNRAPIPLGLGADGPISSSFLLAPRVELQGQGVPDLAEPNVVLLDQRLRLEPGEEIRVEVWPDPRTMGWRLDLRPVASRVRWRVLQGFRIRRGGDGFEVGAFSIETESDRVLRVALTQARSDPQAMFGWVQTGDPLELAEAIAAIRWRTLLSADPASPMARFGLSQQGVEAMVNAMIQRYDDGTTAERLLIAMLAPNADSTLGFAPLDDHIRADGDRWAQVTALITRVFSPEDPLLDELAASDDPAIRRAAETVRRRLVNGRQTFSRYKPEIGM